MRLAIVGSRKFKNIKKVREYVQALPKDTVVVSGGAVGVDSVAVFEARKCGLEVEVYPADWEANGKKAGFIRNSIIVDVVDVLVAFYDGTSRGTADAIDKARVYSKLKEVIDDN